jgi:hypothetical protein
MPEPVFTKLGMYIMALKPISTAYFINPPDKSVCLYVYPLIVARQRLDKPVRAATNAPKNRRIFGRIVFCEDHVVSKESLWVCRSTPLLFLGNGLVNTFPRQQRISVGVTLYAVNVVSKESRWLVLPRPSCLRAGIAQSI